MSTPTMDDAAKVLADPQAYTDESKLHAALAHLRANAPVSWVEVPNYRPFWAITKHADIMDIERNNAVVHQLAAPGPDDDGGRRVAGRRGRAHADPPGRPTTPGGAGDRRGLVPAQGDASVEAPRGRAGQELCRQDAGGRSRMRFRPRGRGELPAVRDHVAAGDTRIGLLAHAQAHPGAVRKRRQRIQTRQLQRGSTPALLDMFGYFNGVTASRREHPTEDLASAIANARIDGEPLSDIDTVSYYLIVATAGTTPPARRSPVVCMLWSRTPTNVTGCATIPS